MNRSTIARRVGWVDDEGNPKEDTVPLPEIEEGQPDPFAPLRAFDKEKINSSLIDAYHVSTDLLTALQEAVALMPEALGEEIDRVGPYGTLDDIPLWSSLKDTIDGTIGDLLWGALEGVLAAEDVKAEADKLYNSHLDPAIFRSLLGEPGEGNANGYTF